MSSTLEKCNFNSCMDCPNIFTYWTFTFMERFNLCFSAKRKMTIENVMGVSLPNDDPWMWLPHSSTHSPNSKLHPMKPRPVSCDFIMCNMFVSFSRRDSQIIFNKNIFHRSSWDLRQQWLMNHDSIRKWVHQNFKWFLNFISIFYSYMNEVLIWILAKNALFWWNAVKFENEIYVSKTVLDFKSSNKVVILFEWIMLGSVGSGKYRKYLPSNFQ